MAVGIFAPAWRARIKHSVIPFILAASVVACSGEADSVAAGGSTASSTEVGAPTASGGGAANGSTTGNNGGSTTTPDGGTASPVVTVPPVPVSANEAAVIASLTNVGIAGRTYYVAKTGSDNNSGLALDAAFLTIERALSRVNPGDTIEVRAGTYAPNGNGFPISRSGTSDARIKIKAYNDEKVILNASGKGYAMYVNADVGHWIIEGLEMSGGSSYTIKIDGHHVNLVKCNLHGSSNDIMKLVQTSDDVVIYGNEIHHNNASPGANAQGIDIVGADRTWIAHNYVHHTASIAIYSKGNSRNTLIEHNRVEAIPSRGIMLGQSTDGNLLWDGVYETYDGIIRNNIVIDTSDACLATASSMNVKIFNNSCYNAATASHGAIFVSNESVVGTAGLNIEIKNNIIATRGRPVLKLGPNALADIRTLHVDNNVYWANGAAVTFLSEDHGLFGASISAWRNTIGTDANSLVADPKYASTSTLTLSLDSPAIDAGSPTNVVTVDYLHQSRPLGARIDIGAYEAK